MFLSVSNPIVPLTRTGANRAISLTQLQLRGRQQPALHQLRRAPPQRPYSVNDRAPLPAARDGGAPRGAPTAAARARPSGAACTGPPDGAPLPERPPHLPHRPQEELLGEGGSRSGGVQAAEGGEGGGGRQRGAQGAQQETAHGRRHLARPPL